MITNSTFVPLHSGADFSLTSSALSVLCLTVLASCSQRPRSDEAYKMLWQHHVSRCPWQWNVVVFHVHHMEISTPTSSFSTVSLEILHLAANLGLSLRPLPPLQAVV